MKKKTMIRAENEGDYCNVVRKVTNNISLFVLLFFMLVAALPTLAAAEETEQKEGWQFGASLYLWLGGMGAKTTGGNNIQLDVDDILHNLQSGFMGGAEARNGRWSLTTDVITMELKGDNSNSVTASVGLPGHEITVDTDATVRLQAWVVTPLVGYTFFDSEKLRAEVVAGARYLWLKTELELEVAGPLQPKDKSISASGNVWDGVVGIRGKVNLNKNWYLPYYADIGTGQSAFTWQAMAGVGYKISKVVDVVVAYRYLYWKFNDTKLLDKLDLGGPLIGLKFQF